MNDISFAGPDKEQECVEMNFCNIKCVQKYENNASYNLILGAYMDQLIKDDEEDPFLRRPGSAMR